MRQEKKKIEINSKATWRQRKTILVFPIGWFLTVIIYWLAPTATLDRPELNPDSARPTKD